MIFCQTSFWLLFRDQLIQTSALEWFGTITGFICVYLAAKQHVLNWPIAILSIISYMVLFYQYKLYGDAALQVYFLITSIYGWYYWGQRNKENTKPIISLNASGYIKAICVSVMLSVILGIVLNKFTDTDVPYIDGTCTAISLVAQVLLTRKIIQTWLLWIVVDICYIPLYLYKDLALTAVLYTLYLVLAVLGYLNWKRTWKLRAE